MLLIAGGLIIGGLALSIWGNQVIFEDFVKKENNVSSGEKMIVEATMKESEKGVFAVEVLGLKKETIFVIVKDPFGNQISQETVDQEAFEGYFDADTSGNYTLIVENLDESDMFIAGYIGPEPDASKRTIAFVSIYVLVIGLISIVIAIIYAIAKRKND